MSVIINLPPGINGVTEVGIAAGVDSFVTPGYQVQVVMAATSSAPANLTAAEERALALLATINMTSGDAAKWVIASSDPAVEGPSGAKAADIRDLITGFPADLAGCSTLLSAPATVTKQAAYATWATTPAHSRPHLKVDIGGTLKASKNICTTPLAKKLWQGMLAFILANGWIVKRSEACDGLVSYHGPEAHPVAVVSGDVINNIGFHDPSLCATLLASLKITWFMTNHHVGQREGELAGFIGKVANIQGLRSANTPIDNTEVRMVLWCMGKMTTTRGLLQALGVKGIKYADQSNTSDASGNDYALDGKITIAASPDIALRVAGSPAGTASLMTYLALSTTAVSSVYSVCIPVFTSIGWDTVGKKINGAAVEAAARVRADPAAHHMGAHFLTGNARIIEDPFSDDEKASLSAYIHATASNSSLAKAAVILPKAEVTSSIVFTTISHVRARMATSMGDGMSAMLVSRMGGGTLAGGAGVQFGKLTATQVTEVQDLVAAYDAGEVSEDEDEGSVRTTAAKARVRASNTARSARRTMYNKAAKVLGN